MDRWPTKLENWMLSHGLMKKVEKKLVSSANSPEAEWKMVDERMMLNIDE